MQEKNTGGYSLLEVLIALTALAILILPLLSLFILSTDFSHRAGRQTRGTLYAQDKMEQLRAEGFGSLRQRISGGYYLVPEEEWEEMEGFTRYYSLQLVTEEISPGGDGPPLVIQLILVEVFVQGDEGKRETVLTSYLAPR